LATKNREGGELLLRSGNSREKKRMKEEKEGRKEKQKFNR
jgi:hypothetical protein